MIRRSLAALCLSAALIPVASARAAVPAVPPGPATSGDFAGPVAIPDGRRLYLECHGIGSPTVIFEAGLRGRGDGWYYTRFGTDDGVFQRVASVTRACTYDRPGTVLDADDLSRSDPVPMPRSTGEVVTDLQTCSGAPASPGRTCWSGPRPAG